MQQQLKYQLFISCIAAMLLFAGCSKDDGDISGTAKISVTHAATEAAALDAYIGTEKITTAPLIFGATTGTAGNPYLTVNAGVRYFRVSPDGTTNFIQGNIPFATDGVYSLFAYDSVGVGGILKTLVLTDNLAAPADNKAHIRFLQLSPDTGRINVQLTNPTDTIPFSSKAYVGSLVTDASLGNFSAVNAGDYTLRVTTSGTVAPILYTLPISFTEGKIYTIYSRGKKTNGFSTPTGFNISTITHN